MKRSIARPLLALAALALPLLAVEAAVRLFFRDGMEPELLQPEAGERYAAARMLASVEEDGVRYLGRPGASVTIRGIEYRHNALGLREREVTPKEPGVTRILLLGDSNTYGWGVAAADALPRRLEERLNARLGARCVECVNAGVPGYNVRDVAALERRLAPVLAPDVVVYVFFVNDLERLGFHVDAAGYLFCDPLPLPDAWKPALWRSFAYRRLSLEFLGRIRERGDYELGKGSNLVACEAALRELASDVKTREASLVIADLPVLETAAGARLEREGYVARDASAWVAGMGEALGVEVVDLLEPLEGEAVPLLWASIEHTDHHPNAKAHAVMAEWLAERLVEMGAVGDEGR